MKTMLNPLWSGLKLVMADTSAEISLLPNYEARLKEPRLRCPPSRVAVTRTRDGGHLFLNFALIHYQRVRCHLVVFKKGHINKCFIA